MRHYFQTFQYFFATAFRGNHTFQCIFFATAFSQRFSAHGATIFRKNDFFLVAPRARRGDYVGDLMALAAFCRARLRGPFASKVTIFQFVENKQTESPLRYN